MSFFANKKKKISLVEFIRDFNLLDPEVRKIFQILKEVEIDSAKNNFVFYLKSAFLLLHNVDNKFIEMRSLSLLGWLIELLLNMQNLSVDQFAIHTHLHEVAFPFQSKFVLGVFIAFDILESFFLKVENVKQLILKARLATFYVENSFFYLVNKEGDGFSIYLEVQKANGVFEEEEIALLKNKISLLISSQIEQLHSSLVIPTNHEFLMKSFKWIMSELVADDLPHVFIDYTQQNFRAFNFSVLICQIKSSSSLPLSQQLKHPYINFEASSNIEDQNIWKEGVILSIEIPLDFSLNAIKARDKVANLLESLIGSFRDVNGGLLEKINENFKKFSQEIEAPLVALTNFFYGITPQENQAIVSVQMLKILYKNLEQHKQETLDIHYKIEELEDSICITIKMPSFAFEKEFKEFLLSHFFQLVFSSIVTKSTNIIGVILKKDNSHDFQKLKELAFRFYKKWTEKKEIKQVLKLTNSVAFSSFDPRSASDEASIHLQKMLFEGLTRINAQGLAEPALAHKIEVSEDKLCYRFFLRESLWSNGKSLTAHDFAYSWKTSLQPTFLSPLSYLFYCIKNAKEVKEGRIPLDSLGIYIKTDLILEVVLSYPTPCFLELCAHSVFSPINQSLDQENPSWSNACGANYVCNGPFKKAANLTKEEVILIKNSFYWESSLVLLEKIIIQVGNEEKTLFLFKTNQIDAIFSPFYKKPTLIIKNSSDTKKYQTIQRLYLSINCSKGPFQSCKIRKAISLALQREFLIPYWGQNSLPAYSLYSPRFTQLNISQQEAEDISLAKKLFKEGLQELGMSATILEKQKVYISSTNAVIGEILVNQINSTFKLQWEIEIGDLSKIFFLGVERKIHLSFYRWVDRIQDPNYFLESFTSANQFTNFSFWSTEKLQNLIYKIHTTSSTEEKKHLHAQAEKLLCDEMPMIPLLYTQYYFLIQPSLQNVYSNSMQDFDIRYSYKL